MPIRKGFVPRGCVADESSQGDSWYESGIKTSPLHPITWIKKTAAGIEQDCVMHEGPEGGPRGSAPNPPPHPAVRPEDWVESAVGMGTSTAQGPASKRCAECASVSKRSSGSIKGVRWESRAPINTKHGSGIVFPPR